MSSDLGHAAVDEELGAADEARVRGSCSGFLVRPCRRVFSEYAAVEGIVHIVLTTRKGLPRVVRVFIDQLAKQLTEPELFPRPPDSFPSPPRARS